MNYRQRHIQSRYTRTTAVQHGRSSLRPMLVLGGLFLLAMVYILQSNTVAAGSITVQQMEHQVAQLKSDSADLEVQAASLRSLSRIEQSDVAQGLTAKATVSYLADSTAPVAVAH